MFSSFTVLALSLSALQIAALAGKKGTSFVVYGVYVVFPDGHKFSCSVQGPINVPTLVTFNNSSCSETASYWLTYIKLFTEHNSSRQST
jgi:hypothetical protein